jgi:DNA-binding PucR family transcriptional regulator
VVGSLVLPRDVRQSLAAAEALALIEIAGDRQRVEPILVDDHLLDLVLCADQALLERLTRQLLAPLDAIPESARERLAVTLLAWLAHAGARNAVAQALHVHPQTVRYRMTQLREAFGDVLDDPERRTALTVVLRAAYGPVPKAGAHRGTV